MPRFVCISQILFLVLAAGVSGSAQDRSDTCCFVAGSVQDPSGLPMPGVVVSLEAVDRSERFYAATEGDGRFRFDAVPSGRYRLEALLEGFSPYERRIRVRADMDALAIRMEIHSRRDEITVTARDEERLRVEPAENRDSVEINRDDLDKLPSLDQDFVGLGLDLLDQGVVGSEGASLVVDGMETDDLGVTPSAIEEVRVNKNPYSAEYSRPGRGRVEVITKEGSAEYHGTLNFFLRNHRLDARNAFAAERPKQQRRRFEGHLSGPLGRTGKNTFLVSAERDLDDEEAVVFARTPDGNVSQTFPRPERETEVDTRFNRYVNDDHIWSLRYSFDHENETGSGVGGFELPEAAYTEREVEHEVSTNHKWFLGPSWLVDFTARLERERERSESGQPDQPRIVVLDAFTGGSAQRSEHGSETELELALISSWTAGDHLIRGGVLVPGLSRHSIDDLDNFGGTYQFASLADFEAGNPFSFTQRRGNPHLGFWTHQVAGFVQDDIRLRPGLTLAIGLRYDRQSFLEDRNNLAPRASMAWAFGKERKTVLRAGAGVFYDRTGSSAIQDVLRFDGLRLREILIRNPAFPDPSVETGNLSEAPQSIVRFAPGIRSPYLTQYSVGIEHKLQRSLTLAATYVGVRGTKLFRSIDRNAPLAPEYLRPDPRFADLREIRSSGTLKSHSLNLNLRGRITRIFRGRVLYTWGRAYNDTEGRDELPPDSRDLRGEWARADFDRRHRLRVLGTLGLPGQIDLGAIFRAESGRPYEWTTGEDRNGDGRANERPEGVGRNAFDGPGSQRLDLRVSRQFQLRDRDTTDASVTLAADAFNVLNSVTFSRIVGNESSPFFGRAVSAESARRLQLSVRLRF